MLFSGRLFNCRVNINKNNEISQYNIQTRERHELVSLNEKEFPKNNRYQIRFVDKNTIIFSHYPRYLYSARPKSEKHFKFQ